MSAFLFFVLLQHPILAAKAGYITYINGMTNVKLQDFIKPAQPVQTFRHTKIEAMLNPGSYLRVDENTEIVLESASLQGIAIRLNKGSIVIDAANITAKTPITVRSEDLEFQIVKPGFYRFSEGSANVHEGKLNVPSRATSIEKQWKMTWFESAIEKRRIEKWESHPLEKWSRYRSAQIYSRSMTANAKTKNTGGVTVYRPW